MSILEFNNVKKEYRLGETTVRALRGVDLTVGKGEFIAVLGASGSGKTTLLNPAGTDAHDLEVKGDWSLVSARISSSSSLKKRSMILPIVMEI